MPTLPLRPNEHIVQGNALRLDWETVCPKTASAQEAREPEIYIFGNPPYLGGKRRMKSKNGNRKIYFPNTAIIIEIWIMFPAG